MEYVLRSTNCGWSRQGETQAIFSRPTDHRSSCRMGKPFLLRYFERVWGSTPELNSQFSMLTMLTILLQKCSVHFCSASRQHAVCFALT
ncbi:unnamed protein product [Penicillium roqueforti FM164]|uniref:Genomic scaffold, ProqFM164S03 n=1 Tax=Penicillium roqueforti (strain FM164) TaxID=1365484 RepID=W6QI18_PENRF|nr:unnamed protein product [Penicillium roqueforti FM164]